MQQGTQGYLRFHEKVVMNFKTWKIHHDESVTLEGQGGTGKPIPVPGMTMNSAVVNSLTFADPEAEEFRACLREAHQSYDDWYRLEPKFTMEFYQNDRILSIYDSCTLDYHWQGPSSHTPATVFLGDKRV